MVIWPVVATIVIVVIVVGGLRLLGIIPGKKKK
jgi:hypothetical protein